MKKEENKGGKDIMTLSKRVYRMMQAVQTFSFEEKRQLITSLLSPFSKKERVRWFRWVRDYVHQGQKCLKIES